MVYMGSKNRIAKYLLPFLTKYLTPGRWYVEPFVGGANLIDKIKHNKRIGSDINKYLIALFEALQIGVDFPTYITKEEYNKVRDNKDKYPDWYVGYVAYVCSFRGIYWGSHADNNNKRKNGRVEHRQAEQIRNFLSQKESLKDVFFKCSPYDELDIPNGSIVYCDPPYAGTSDYKQGCVFDSNKFFDWCRIITNKGNDVFISEYNAPNDFIEIWNMGINMNLNSYGRKPIEKLFVHESIADKYKVKTLFD